MVSELKLDGWIYKTKVEHGQLDFEILSPGGVEKPTVLFKLYTPSSYAVESLTKNYLYGNHPMQFNDLFDCHKNLIICDDEENDKVTLAFLKEIYGEKEFEEMDEKQLKERIIEGRYDLAYITFGIACLTSNPNNVLMWAYYGNNQGYMVEYDITKLPANFHGPFPINYQEKVIPISHEANNAQLAVLYQSNVKSKAWEHESEWRYLIRSEDGKPLLPFNATADGNTHDRKFSYPEDTVKSISLGNRFFSHEEILEISEENTLKIKFKDYEDCRYEILRFAINNNISLYYGLKQNDLMTVKFRKCRIEQKDDLEFWFY